ncbi:chemotaxis response regulator protein-glutamate methylesterase [Blastopirellula sp. JC732]|uniref:Protein-glutamate methylesterase/protein-glutamine glutaminase n=2 Tax=Blastopirellula sediminis TaxID=2894196 RepID=A0A9X1MQV2_9BACT|nr:chemotaxis response regulator protein-glutamate methylesterase [Blastopirellula sediminis]MCC9631818.1 chemotaxis response regulator protein-glutamate methylesterase [Blastopirellula sediminis]
MRTLIADQLADVAGIEVCGEASNGQQALQMLSRLQPDVITLDVQMPGMDGLETLDRLLAIRPIPVIMVSAMTQLGGDITLDALERGAFDYVAKPAGLAQAESVMRDDLVRKIRSVADTDVAKVLEIRRARAEARRQRRAAAGIPKKTIAPPPKKVEPVTTNDWPCRCIAIGISTGGPPALTSLFENLPAGLPPIVIVQHMPEQFTRAFAKRLNSISQVEVKEAASGDMLEQGHAYIAQGGKHLEIRRHTRTQTRLEVFDGEPVSGHRPSVDVMMRSAANVFGDACLGVVMTGMGRDGSDGCKAIREAGGYVLGQDEASSDIYGMNRVAFQEGNVDKQFDLQDAAQAIIREAKRLRSGLAAAR